MMKKWKWIRLAALVVAFGLEWLPWGVVMYFGNPEGEPFRSTCAYFDILPYGYGIFGPFLTALLTCVLLVLATIACFIGKRKLNRTIAVLSAVAIVTALSPLLYVANSFTVIGGMISLLITACWGMSTWIGKRLVDCSPF